ncbi:MAG TPA: NUDIX hydrolase [Tepidisphaeraceae bacterium]|nr:NUDIX hydrolase [Tepidisphaeraceae bacterium]
MSDSLKTYLDSHPAHHETTETWPVQGQLRVRLCLGSTLPPAEVSSSILAIVVNSCQQVLFLHPSTPNGSIAHVLIGGRPEPGEKPEQTIVREVGEETGWQIEPGRMIGFRHFFHLEPRSDRTDRPYPDFIQPIFAASAVAYNANLALPDDLIPAQFIDIEIAQGLIEAAQCRLLRAAAFFSKHGLTSGGINQSPHPANRGIGT